MKSVDLMSLWNAVCSVHLCFSVRDRTHPLYEITPLSIRRGAEGEASGG